MWFAFRRAAVGALVFGLASTITGCGADEPLPDKRLGDAPDDSPAHDADAAGVPNNDRLNAVSIAYDRLLEVAHERAAFMCACEVASEDLIPQCVQEAITLPPPPVIACTKALLAQDERALGPLQCELANYEAYLACINESTCLDFDHIFDCDIARRTRAEDCTALPWDLWAANKEHCEGVPQPPGFECANGDWINSKWVCDLHPDCTDASDEVGCTM